MPDPLCSHSIMLFSRHYQHADLRAIAPRRELRLIHGVGMMALTDVARRGKPGVALLSRALEERGPGYVPPGSELEARLLAALTRAGLPEPVRQIQLPGRGAIEGIVDAGYADARLLLEADGRRWHTRLTDRLRDSQRDAEASRAGWLTLRFLYEQITQEPDEVASAVAETRAIRLQQFNHQRAA